MKARLFFTIGFGVCAVMLGVAYFLQYGLHLEPCPLCILERIAVLVTLGLFGLAALHNPGKIGQKIYSLLISSTLILGLGIAGRHLYLQNLPKDQVPDCVPGFDYLIENFPLSEVLTLLVQGSGQCAQVGARLLGLSLSQWTAIALMGLLFWSLSPFFGIIKQKPNL